MKNPLFIIAFLFSLQLFSQSPSGYWYGTANVKQRSNANNYLIELILEPENNNVKGVLNYYFKNFYRSIPIRGTYNSSTKLVYLANIPVSFYGSSVNREIDCPMNLVATLKVSQPGSSLKGSFISQSQYKYTCPEIAFVLKQNTEMLNRDSIINAIKTLKESYQQWRPAETDTMTAVKIQPRNVINYVVSNQYKERDKVIAEEVSVDSDTLRVDFYDNGEIDGDSISVFLNDRLIAFNRILSTRSVRIDIILDSLKEINELSMFADNLGIIPPNTALMVISDSKKRYEVRLSSSFEKNAVVRIRKKKKS